MLLYKEHTHKGLYPLLRNYDVWGETVGINWNTMVCEWRDYLYSSSFSLRMSTVYSFARLVQLFSYPMELFREPMATRAEVDDNDSSPGPSRSCSTAPVHKWTCAALKTWLKVRGLSYSGMKKDELVAK